MLFSSYIFLFAFLPLTLFGYYALSNIRNPYPQRIFLCAASAFFYGWFSWKYLLLFAASIAGNYALAQLCIHTQTEKRRKAVFVCAAAGNLLLLGYYKYLDFFLDSLNSFAHTNIPLHSVLLPLGISFFTFQQIGFQLHVRRGNVSRLPLWDYVLFVSFFPQLVAGPIVRYEEIAPQLRNTALRRPNADNIALGIYTFILGLFKKLVLADTLAVWVDNGFSSKQLGLLPAWFCMLGYAFQIYFDFSGYSDMAVGLGKMFNIDLPLNFYAPYRSESVREFWKRWHITLGRMLAECVYIPLGGNRKGKVRKSLNLFLTFLLSGLWHGANWTFILWGAAHGAARVLEEILEKPLQHIPRRIRQVGTFLFAAGAFTLFRAEDFQQAAVIYRGMLRVTQPGLEQFKGLMNDGILGILNNICVLLAAFAMLCCLYLIFRAKPVPERMKQFRLETRTAVWTAILFIAAILCISRGEVFIYFNF